MKNFLKQILSETNGIFSSTRFIFITWSLAVLIVWISLSFYEGKILSIPETVIYAVAIFAGLKGGQKFGEKV